MTLTTAQLDRACGVLLGTAAGDALGAPYEFGPPSEILERRAMENGVDFVNGVATAITPMAFFETVMAKGYETLVDPDTKVDVSTDMIAAGRLQTMIDSRASRTSMVDMLVKMDRVINAIKSTVPESMWEEIVAKLDEPIAVGPPAG